MLVASALYSEESSVPLDQLHALIKIEAKPLPMAEPEEVKKPVEDKLVYKTLTKYSYFESGGKWCKVLLPELANLKDHPKDKLIVTFEKRSLDVRVIDLKG